MTSHAARLAVFLVSALVLSGCGASPTSPSAVTPPQSPLDAAFARMCPGCVASGAATVLTGTLSISEPGGGLMPSREVEVGTIRLTIRPLSTGYGSINTHRVDIMATVDGRTIAVPATGRITSETPGGRFVFITVTSSDPSARMCAAPGMTGTTAPPLFIWPDQQTSISLLPAGTGYDGFMTYDSCPDNPASLRREQYGVRIP
jgi:hypothetical protein